VDNNDNISLGQVRRASCVCGNFTVDVSGPPVRVAICHCFACQQRTGSVFGKLIM
jgi:hypothetical protein